MKVSSLWCLSMLFAYAVVGTSRSTSQESSPAHVHEQMPASEVVPGDSLFLLPVTLQNSEGREFRLAELRGEPLLVTMFYSHCTSVCPLLTAQLQRLLAPLSASERQKLRVLMVSFDARADTPEALRAFKKEHHIKDDNWIVARASAGDVRVLAATLGIRYRELPDHTFNHSAVISLTDLEGTVRARTSDLTGSDDAFLSALRAQIASAVHAS